MKTAGNTILITGGGTGIGRGLAEAFHKLGNKIIIAGRRKEKLDETAAANPGMVAEVLDVQDANAIHEFAAKIVAQYPQLNVLVNNAGIGAPEKLRTGKEYLRKAEEIIATNLLAPMRLSSALVTHFQTLADATIVNVGSGLAHLPLAAYPTYSATKAALHSYTQSLRYQLQETSVEVLELIPPAVQSGATGTEGHGMPLDQYISESMALFQTKPTPQELCVESVKMLRFAEASGDYYKLFNGLNATFRI